jgi:2,4-dienoyl-CoA reductase-like NADH-dependent reductase (Old Yellow Enzyme family)/thioredoxin reductase
MAPVKTGYGDKFGNITDRHIQFYKRRAKHLGAITLEPLFLDSQLRELPTQIGIDSDDKINGLKKLTDEIHKFDTKVIAHLNHPGRMANPKIPGNKYLSSTNVACEMGGATPKAMTQNDIDNVINLFVKSAVIAEKSGFDIIELQFGHGYLIAQFLSPKVNDRSDEYGGSFENRTRLPLQIIDAVKAVCNLPIIARISGDEMIEGGIKIKEMIEFAQLLDSKSIDAIHVSAGTVCNTPPWYFQHMFVPKGKTWELANKIKASVKLPIIYVGQINEFEDVDKIINDFKGDLVAIGRPLVADPDFVGKYLGEINGNLRPCMACSEGCLGGVKSGQGLGCIINPLVGKENETIAPPTRIKNIAVVGGGLSGMTSAITLKQRGHKVTLFEKNKLGGQFDFAPLPPHKASLQKMIDYLAKEVNDKNVKIQKKEFPANDNNGFDELVIATGSEPIIPPIEGLKDFYWAEILEENNLPKNKNTLVIGGGLIGTEIANKLLSVGNKIFIVEMLGEIARGMEMIEQKLTLKALKNENVSIITNTKVNKIDGKTVYLESESGNSKLENIDVIVIATGMKSYQPFETDAFDCPTHIVGDAEKVGKAKNAIESAYRLANTL